MNSEQKSAQERMDEFKKLHEGTINMLAEYCRTHGINFLVTAEASDVGDGDHIPTLSLIAAAMNPETTSPRLDVSLYINKGDMFSNQIANYAGALISALHGAHAAGVESAKTEKKFGRAGFPRHVANNGVLQ